MSEYPLVTLSGAVIVQPAVTTDTFKIVQVAENPDEMWVNAFVSGATQNSWVCVLNAENYFPEWTDQTIIDAVTAWAEETFPPA
jgi:hypothetical protein